MIFLAIRIDGKKDEEVMHEINTYGRVLDMICDMTPHALKERVRANLTQNPNHIWLIVNSNTHGYVDNGKVRFT